MKEALLHFVWQYQLIRPERLETTNGQQIEIINCGTYNKNESADFLDAKIRIGNLLFIGNIEIHINSSDWRKHQHQTNKKYNNVILHIVYNDDEPLKNIPTLELNGKLPPYILQKYGQLMQSKLPVPCQFDWKNLSRLEQVAFQDRFILERLNNKSKKILQTLQLSNNDWLQTKYTLLLKYFGGNVNQFGFAELASRLDYKILIKHADNLFQIEALLFGTAGFLEDDIQDIYYEKLKKEYQYLQLKYNIISLKKTIWNFMRMRPASFPTLKIALLAAVIHASPQLYQMQHIENAQIFLANIAASNYWDKHYQFGKESNLLVKHIGKSSIHALLINYNIPLFYTYQTIFEQKDVLQSCIEHYEKLPFEQNHKVKYFKTNISNPSALDSQVLIELYDAYCSPKRCLDCPIGFKILKNITIQTQELIRNV